jgi:hypothetical protein
MGYQIVSFVVTLSLLPKGGDNLMNYIYLYRQAHQDRLEAAGVVQYRPADGIRLRLPRLGNYRAPVRRLRAAALAVANLIAR